MAESKTVAIVATLDTKGLEVAFVRDVLRRRGLETVVIDTGVLGEPATPADITREEVASAGGADLAELKASRSRGRAMQAMIDGVCRIVPQLYLEGRLHGVLALGGAQNTTLATAAMRTLPLGVPKLVLSTMASGRYTFGPYVGTKDVTIMHSVADVLGINAITARIYANAANAIAGMVSDLDPIQPSGRPVIGATMMGVTTPCVMRARAMLEQRGFEVVVFHANGTGGRAMEELIESGSIHATLDITTHELTDGTFGGDAGYPGRLTAGTRRPIPQVVVPGATDFLCFGPLESLRPEHAQRQWVIHNPYITLVRASPDEMRQVAQIMAERLNAALGPIVVLLPLRGFSDPNQEGREIWNPSSNEAMMDELRRRLRPEIEVIELDAHINDPAFAEAAAASLVELMAG